jgi:hypothetical protein
MSSSENIFKQFIAHKICVIHVGSKFSPHISKVHGFHEKTRGRKLLMENYGKKTFRSGQNRSSMLLEQKSFNTPYPYKKKRKNKIYRAISVFAISGCTS